MAEQNKNSSTMIEKGSYIYKKGDAIDSISIVLKGKVSIQNGCIRSVVGVGSVLGVTDLYEGNYRSDFIAYEDAVVTRVPISSVKDLIIFCENSKAYSGHIISYLSKYIQVLFNTQQNIYDVIIGFNKFLNEIYEEYKQSCLDNMLNPINIDISGLSVNEIPATNMTEEIEYYIACNRIPSEIQKEYYAHGKAIFMKHISEQINIISGIYDACKVMARVIDKIAGLFINNYDSLFNVVKKLVLTLSEIDVDNGNWIEKGKTIVSRIEKLEEFCKENMGRDLGIDKNFLMKEYKVLLAGCESQEENSVEKILNNLRDSTSQILAYADANEEEKAEFISCIDEYKALTDIYSKENDVMKLRHRMSDIFYSLYLRIFKKAYVDIEVPDCVRLFLDYGFADEKLLTREELEELVSENENDVLSEPCNVYTISQWLTLIYNGEKEPSKNDFDLDYEENLREMLKNKEITQKEANMLQDDRDKKLEYEINNFFKTNNRLVSTNVTTFFPILCSDKINMGVAKTKLTKYRINSAIKKIIAIDYSVFSREVLYTNKALGIEKDYIIKEVFPDIILMPNYGDKGVMWQNIAGRKRDTSARFVFPAFLEVEEFGAMLPVIGRFRWEMCRTIQGVKWNDVRERSLTSEYQDYIQFFRKNVDINEEWREKIKKQIKNCRNNTREVFTRDYIEWIIRESAGTIKLNKVVRDIMATYCPFSKEIRKKQENQILYLDAMRRFTKKTDKMQKLYDSKCLKLEKAGKEIPPEIAFTRDYYYK